MKTIYIERVKIDGVERIKLNFRYDPEVITDLKKLPGLKWFPDRKNWHLPDMEHPTTNLRKALQSKYRVLYNDRGNQGNSSRRIRKIFYQEISELDRIYIKFDYDKDIIDLIKTFDDYCWHQGRKVWSIKGGKKNLRGFIQTMVAHNIKPIADDFYRSEKKSKKSNPFKVDHSVLPSKLMNYLVLRNYSEKTIRIYKDHIAKFLQNLSEDELQNLTPERISEIIHSRMVKTNYSRSYQNQMISAIKLFYKVMKNQKLDTTDIPRPKKEKTYPNIFSRDEIKLIIENLHNLKHKTVIALLYGTGIRLGESVNIKITDIDFQRKLIYIRSGKGKKDRIVPLPEIIVELVNKYTKQYAPTEYLFEGQNNPKYSPRSVQAILEKILIKVNIRKKVSIHTFRHTFATHAIEDGYNIRLVQEILGHSNLKTTEIYLHLTNTSILSVKSPIDKLGLKSS